MSNLFKQLNNLDNVSQVKNVQYSIFNPEMIRKGGVCEVNTTVLYDNNGNGKIGGIHDPRMGVIEFGKICPTCENRSDLCTGHFGFIDLAIPCFLNHNVHNKSLSILKLLRCICFRCSKLLIDKSDPQIQNAIKGKANLTRFNVIYGLVQKIAQKNNICKYNDGCFHHQPKYTKIINSTDIIEIVGEFLPEAFKDSEETELKQIFSAEICHRILSRVTNEDVEYLGLNPKYSRPEWLITTVFPVPPPAVRPSIRQDNNVRSEDDLSYILQNIVKYNNEVKKYILKGDDKKTINRYYKQLQWHVATFVDNEITGLNQNAQRNKRALKALRQRLKAKEGRVRGNIMGKRVDYSARTVISGDPDIGIEEYGIPKQIAMNITIPETVTPYNIDKMYELVRNGSFKYPGAKIIKKMSHDCNGNPYPCMILLKYTDVNSVVLHYGDVVMRHVQEGDYAIFNRQPTLHRMSMMAHKIRILEGNTFRLNLNVAAIYNADCDGDEMNGHFPQSSQSAIEIKYLTQVPKQIISPAKCKPIVTIVQDGLVGSYLLSDPRTRISRKNAFDIMMSNTLFNGVIDKEVLTGKDIFSLILPPVSIEGKGFRFTNGFMEDGRLNKHLLGGNSSGLIQNIYNQFGYDKCREFVNNTKRLVTRWLVTNSFSIGIDDCIPPKWIVEETNRIIDEKLKKGHELLEKAYIGAYKPNLGDKYMRKSLEEDLKSAFSAIQADTQKYIKYISTDNGFRTTITSGSKGAETNIDAIMIHVGQQAISGRRAEFTFTDRTLPHFHKFDHGANARGYVRNPYINGMKAEEVFFHAMGGRVGLIDTAVKTAKSGYIQRRLMKASEDVRACYDTTVRNSANNIVQFLYGDDGYDGMKLEKEHLITMKLSNYEFDKKYKWDKMNSEMETEYKDLVADREFIKTKWIKGMKMVDDVVFSPVNFYRLIKAAKYKFGDLGLAKVDVDASYFIKRNRELCDEIVRFYPDKRSCKLIKMIIRAHLASKVCMEEYRMTKKVYDYIYDLTIRKIRLAIVAPAETVGCVSAASLGEISTQLTLNTFHSSGIGSKSVVTTQGVPRLDEIINLTKKIKTPSMTVFMKEHYSKDYNIIDKVASMIQHTKVRDIVNSTQILYEGGETLTGTDEELEFMSIYREFNDILEVDKVDEDNLSNWILHFDFNKETMLAKGIYMQQVQEIIMATCNGDNDIQCIFSDDNNHDLVLRLRIKHDAQSGSYISFLNDLENCIMDINLKGIEGIGNLDKLELNRVAIDMDGAPEVQQEWAIKTDGTNLLAVFGMEQIDELRTLSNDIKEMYEIFDIEAARELLIRELREIFGEDINYRHICMLVDVMTYKGKLISVARHGINKAADNSLLNKATFEEITDVLVKASIFSEKDNMRGVSGNIMMGQYYPVGTNGFEVLIDEDIIMEYGADKEETITMVEDLETKINNEYKDVDNVRDKDFEFGYNIGSEFKLSSINFDDDIIII